MPTSAPARAALDKKQERTTGEPKLKSLANVDPKLLEQLNAHTADATPLQAVFYLRPEESGSAALPAARTESLAREIVERVRHRLGETPERMNVFKHMSSFAVQASAKVLREIINQPEISSAVSNRRNDEQAVAAV